MPSVLYVVSYLSMGLPAVLAGAAIVVATALAFGAVVIVLAVFALVADKALEG